jgi:hypothetical protein
MSRQSTRALRLTALGLVGFHFLTVVLHSIAHEVLGVKATPAQLAFVVPFIIVGPLAAGLMLQKFARGGAVLLAVSMLGSFVFGLYYHFIADTIDHVAHVARLEPAFWSSMFTVTSYLLLASEAAGAAVAWPLIANAPRPFKNHAARTGL